MPRPRLEVPSYRLHKPSGKAICTVRNPDGTRRDIVLGDHGSPESKAAYARVCGELTAGGVAPAAGPDPGRTVTELCVLFGRHAAVYYRDPDGTPTTEVKEIRLSLRALRRLYGETPVLEFGPKALAAWRTAMAAAGWCRPLINRRADRIKRMFKWAVAEELVPPAVYDGLRALAGLKAGRCDAREPDPVAPVPAADFEATLPRLPRAARAVCELMRLTGMRPGEACRLSWDEIDRTGDVWAFRPERHKTRHRGKWRTVMFGPKAQAVLLAYQGDRPAVGPVFCAARDREERLAARRAARVTPMTPSQRKRVRKAAPKRAPRPGYSPHALAHAVTRAAKAAGVPPWHPNQVRHLVATEVRKAFGLEAAQVVLGHARADVTQVYAERDEAKAADVAARIG